MNSVFITGISTAGKSYLAEKVARALGIDFVKTDMIREEMKKDPNLEPWVNFYWNKDEAEYYRTTTAEEQWRDLVQQSEAFWPTMKRHIEMAMSRPTIFEGVTLLPHLMRELPLKGIVLLGRSEEEVRERLAAEPRWGTTAELQWLEACATFGGERPRYATEAEEYGYASFDNVDDAEKELTRLILHLVLPK